MMLKSLAGPHRACQSLHLSLVLSKLRMLATTMSRDTAKGEGYTYLPAAQWQSTRDWPPWHSRYLLSIWGVMSAKLLILGFQDGPEW